MTHFVFSPKKNFPNFSCVLDEAYVWLETVSSRTIFGVNLSISYWHLCFSLFWLSTVARRFRLFLSIWLFSTCSIFSICSTCDGHKLIFDFFVNVVFCLQVELLFFLFLNLRWLRAEFLFYLSNWCVFVFSFRVLFSCFVPVFIDFSTCNRQKICDESILKEGSALK